MKQEIGAAAMAYGSNAESKHTQLARRRGFRRFEKWCSERGLFSLPATPETVSDFVSHRARCGKKMSTIDQEVWAIGSTHENAGICSPAQSRLAKKTLKGIRRTIGSMVDKAPPIMRDDLRIMAATFEDKTLRDARDRAVLLLGWLAVCRSSEIRALNVEDFKVTADGAEVLIRRSKNDQEGVGLTKICYYAKREPELCAVLAVQRWLRLSGLQSGPLFPSIWTNGKVGRGRMDGEGVARIVQRAAKRAGIEDRAFVTHSLRVGAISQMAVDGVPLEMIREHSGLKSLTALLDCIRRAQRWDGKGATAGLL